SEIPGLQKERAAILLHLHFEVLLFPDGGRARDFDIDCGKQRSFTAMPEGREREHGVHGCLVDLANLQHRVDIEPGLEILRPEARGSVGVEALPELGHASGIKRNAGSMFMSAEPLEKIRHRLESLQEMKRRDAAPGALGKAV